MTIERIYEQFKTLFPHFESQIRGYSEIKGQKNAIRIKLKNGNQLRFSVFSNGVEWKLERV